MKPFRSSKKPGNDSIEQVVSTNHIQSSNLIYLLCNFMPK